MTSTAGPCNENEEAAEARVLAAAVAQANPPRVPHEDARPWLLRIAAGAFDTAPAKAPRKTILASAPLDGINLDRDRDTGRDLEL